MIIFIFFTTIAESILSLERPFTLVFDIGKTTKKILVFDDHFNVVCENAEQFAEISDDDGFRSEDLRHISIWMKETLSEYIVRYPHISAINFSAYGASLAHLDEKDELIEPFYNYLKPLPDGSKLDFLKAYDDNKDICTATASPWLGMLNSGLQLYWLKKYKPELFARIKTSLHLPQYFSFLVSGKKFSDTTSVGCHTMLWDFERKTYHRWVHREGLIGLFPLTYLPDHTLFEHLHGRKRRIGIGVHDSSAALMPYLISMHERFLLLSTGTWNITFNPFNHELLTQEELDKDCLCYLTYQGNPVKASRIFLGHEHELQVKSIASHFEVPPDSFLKTGFDNVLYENLSGANGTEQTIYSIGMEGTGPFPEKVSKKTDWASFKSPVEAYHAMIRQLVRWQITSINLINRDRHVENLIVVGGFTKNPVFLEMLKREAKYLNIFLSDHSHASAMGAAWLVNDPMHYQRKKSILNIIPA